LIVTGRTARLIRPTGPDHRVTNLELFFDLVFVFAFTQVTALVAGAGDGLGALRGLILAALLWWVWCSYSWLCNQARADAGVIRQAMFVALAAMMVLALALPQAFEDVRADGEQGLSAPLVLVCCMTVVQWCHLGSYVVAALDDHGLRRQIALVALPVLVGNLLLVVGALAAPPHRTWWWAAGMAINYTGIYVAGASGWRLPAPGHFAERYALIVLVALGESIVSIGVGVAELPLTVPVLVATVAAIVLTTALWWLYFDRIAPVLEHRLTTASGVEQTRLARDTFTYLHFPLVVAVLTTAVGVKKVFGYVADTHAHRLSDAVHGIPGPMLAGGTALYLLALSALGRRNLGRFDPPGLVAAAALTGLAALAGRLPALASILAVAAVLAVLVLTGRRRQTRSGADTRSVPAPDRMTPP
jgi:low temperature requirement protein LtrA